MNRIVRNTIAAACFCMFSITGAKAQTFNPQLAAMLQDTLNYWVAAVTNIKGMSASVYVPGQGTWQSAAGLSWSGHPATADMEFGIASNTKTFVAAAMLILAQDHIISLNDPLSKWLPTYKNINPNITIRQLLNHTSGVQDPIFVSPWVDTIRKYPSRVFTANEVAGWVGTPTFPAGTSWAYSNMNYVLAGMVAESATGFHISRLIRDSILTPLQLTNTFYDAREPIAGTVAHRWYNSVDYNDTPRIALNTAGGCAGAIFSTCGDMVKWYNALMTGKLLTPASFAELTTFVNTFGPPFTYGLGLENQAWFGHNTYGHDGVTWGYKSRMVYDPCLGVAVCGLVNSWPAGNDGVTMLLYRVVVNHLPGCVSAISGATSVCKGQKNVTYSVAPIANAVTYSWTLPKGATGSSNTNTISVNFGTGAATGNITVKGTNMYGDGSVSILKVNVNSLPDATITPAGPTSLCQGGGVVLNTVAAPYHSYQWKKGSGIVPGATLSSYTATASAGYKVIVTNTQTGCTKTTPAATVVTIYALPSAIITPQGPTTFCTGDSVVLSANAGTGYTYQWKRGTAAIAGATLQNYTATKAGTYKVTVTNANGCSKTSAGQVITVNCFERLATGTPAVEMSVSPNPTRGLLNLVFNSHEGEQAEVTILDITGRNMIHQLISTKDGTNQRLIDIRDFLPGWYLVKIKTPERVLVTPVIKE